MKRKNRYLSIFASLALCGALVASTGASRPAAAAKHPADAASSIIMAEPQPEPVARVIAYGPKDVVTVRTRVRFTTLIILPQTEQILDFACGDKEFWVVNGNQNFAYVKPAKIGAKTNLNLVTASGNVYSFVLSEVSESPREQPDLKLFVELKDESMVAASRSAPKFVSAEEVQQYKDQADRSRDEARQAKQAAQEAIDKGIRQFATNVRFSYRFEAGRKPFSVRAMYHDERFTYIQARPEETPTLYEVKDGQPNLVNFTYKDGVYVVNQILDRGYLAIGKQKLSFTREE